MSSGPQPSKALIILAFACIYLIWGSTYLAIRVAVEHIPPLVMAGCRNLLAGVVLYLLTWARGSPRPGWRHWRSATVVGGMLLLGGNGGLCWAEQYVSTGVCSLIIATVPLWIMLFAWIGEGQRPHGLSLVGLGLGFAGLVLLVYPSLSQGPASQPLGIFLTLFSSINWAIGSLLSRRLEQVSSTTQATAMQMLAGGGLLVLAGTLWGELPRLSASSFSWEALTAMAYLVIFGSMIGFTAYVWLLEVVSPAAVATYAYINPIVAIVLGGLFLHEDLGPRTLLAAVLTLVGVAFITLSRR